VDEDAEMALPGFRVKSRLPFVARRTACPMKECTNKNDMMNEAGRQRCLGREVDSFTSRQSSLPSMYSRSARNGDYLLELLCDE
jgi:hypothetical protein